MSEVLRPFSEFDSRELARQLEIAVTEAKDMLTARNITGPISRYTQ